MIALLALSVALQAPPDYVIAEHKFQLEAMEMADQEVRNQMIIAMNNQQHDRAMKLMREMERIDRENTDGMKKICFWGWPTISRYGRRHANIAWLLVQHADRHVTFQKKCLAMMEPLVKEGEVTASNYAYLFDRVARNTGKPQRFGTQLRQINGRLVMQETEDPKNVDKRRRAVGLPPMKEYIRRAEEMYSRKS